MPTIAFVTTCKNRLHHIQQTVPLIVSDLPDEVVVVDYGCPQKTGEWVNQNFPTVNVVTVSDDAGFCLARARNTGARQVVSEWICFIDADVLIQPGFVTWLRQNLVNGCHYRAAPLNTANDRDLETFGTFVIKKSDFEMVGGYDEAFRGWGGEDQDIYTRLEGFGSVEHSYPNHFVKAIPHEDQERTTYADVKSRKMQLKINSLYCKSKQKVSDYLQIEQLPFDLRKRLMAFVQESVLQTSRGDLKSRFNLIISRTCSWWCHAWFKRLTNASVLEVDVDQSRFSLVMYPTSKTRWKWLLRSR